MQANERQVKGFMSTPGTRFIIPVYQRNYDWKRKQCEQLLYDVQSAEESKNYFIGSIVHRKIDSLSQDLVIIDGQQRITTLTLLLLVVAEVFKENNDEHWSEVWDYYIQNKYDSADIKLKLKPIASDFEALRLIVTKNYDQIKEGNRLLDNYRYFREKINTLDIAKKVYNNFNYLMIVEIALNESDDPQKIFQSLNSTGLELSQADLIRNYLLMNLDPEYQEKIFVSYWQIIESNCFKKAQNESHLSYFFRDYLTLRYSTITTFGTVFESFRSRFKKLYTNKEEFEAELGKIKLYSGYYNRIINQHEDQSEDKVANELQKLAKLEVTVAYPFLLGILSDYANNLINENQVVEILKLVQSYVFRRFICGYPTGALNKIFMTLHGNATKIKEKYAKYSFSEAVSVVLLRYSSYQRYPTNDEVVESLKKKDIYFTQGKNKLYLLEMLENNYQGFVENSVDLFKRKDITIEHVFPQTPSDGWKKALPVNEFDEMSKRVNTLGNLTIVINNGSLGNRSFIEKRDLNEEKSKGFRYSKFNLNSELANLENWNIMNLDERTAVLTEKFISIWNYPQIELPQDSTVTTEIEISDVGDTTGRPLLYFILNGERFEIKEYSKMFKYLITFLYNEAPDRLFSPEVEEVMLISSNTKDFLSALKFAENHYVEGSNSSRRIIEKVQKLAEIFQDILEIRVAIG